MNRFFASAWAAAVAWWIAAALHVPVWRDWEPGDRSDIALGTFCAVFYAIGHRSRSKAPKP